MRTREEQRLQEKSTFRRAVGIQIAEYGGMGNIPKTIIAMLKKRASALGLDYPKDFTEDPEKRGWKKA